jgi:hypothetical protein
MIVHMAWGFGPDVILSLEGTILVLGESPDLFKNRFVYGAVTKGGIDLTADQAHELGVALIKAASQAKGLDEKYAEVMKREKRNLENN